VGQTLSSDQAAPATLPRSRVVNRTSVSVDSESFFFLASFFFIGFPLHGTRKATVAFEMMVIPVDRLGRRAASGRISEQPGCRAAGENTQIVLKRQTRQEGGF